jgi:hypothetical protein
MKLTPSLKAGIRPSPENWKHAPEHAETHCFYCKRPVPDHKDDCVCSRRTIVVELKSKMVVTVPQYWTRENIDFFFDGSSHCLANEIQQLAEEAKQEENICHVCSRTTVTFVREATAADHKKYSWMGDKD